MKKRAIVATAVAFVLLLAVVAAGLNLIFTVSYMDVTFYAFSETGRQEAALLKEKLDGYIGASTTFLHLSDVEETVGEFSGFRLDEVKKKFPHTVQVTVSERRETYAWQKEDGRFAVFDEAGDYLYDKDKNVNRTGGENILLEGFSFDLSGGGLSGTYGEQLKSIFAVLDERFTAARANVLHIALERPASNPENDVLVLSMREGVRIDLLNPACLAREKTEKSLDTYLSLKDGDRLCGRITAIDVFDTVKVEYSARIGSP